MARYDDDDDDNDRPIKKKKRSGSDENVIVGFLLFRKMVGPWVLTVLYYLVVLIIIGWGGFLIVMAIKDAKNMPAWATVVAILVGLATMIIGPIVYRVGFELMIAIFRIYETLLEIRDKL
jgi:Domain of unknown function (DUF4282)